MIIDLAHGLSERGHEVAIYAAEGSVVDGLNVSEIRVEPQAADAAIHTDVPVAKGAQRALRRGFGRLYSQLRADEPDVVSQHAFDAPAIELADGLAVLHTLHLPPIGDVVAAARATTAPLAAVSHAAAQVWRKVGVPIRYVLPNGVPARTVADLAVMPRALIAGRISPEKGTAIAIRVARQSGLAPLVVGDAYDSEYFAREVEPLLKPGEFIGPVPRAHLFELMARSAVLLMPVRWDEPFGLVAAEAQMAGCPVVAYRRGALPEVVLDGIGGFLVEPENEPGLVGAGRQALGLDRRHIRSRAQRKLGLAAMIDAYENVLTAMGTARATWLPRRPARRRSHVPPAAVRGPL